MGLIVPEVYAQLVREKVQGKVMVMNLASEIGDIPEFAQVGSEITFPKFALIGDAQEIVKGTPMTPESLSQTSSKAQIVQVGKAVRVYDVDAVTGIGNQVEEAANQTAMVIARKLDNDLIVEAKTTPLKKAAGGATILTTDDLEGALGLFGDDIDYDSFAGIVINSRLVKSLSTMDNFIDKNKTTVSDLNGIVQKGLIGYYKMIAVYVSDKGTYDSTTSECITFVIKKNALGYKLKKALNVEEEREAKLKATDIVSDMMYAVHLVDDSGVVMLKKTIA